MANPLDVTDWADQPNPGQDAVRRSHIRRVFDVAVKTLTRCPECSAFLTAAVTHSGRTINVEATAYERFVIHGGRLHAASGVTVRDHRHSCNPAALAMARARAEYDVTVDLTTEADWIAHTEAKLRGRQERSTVFGDVPDPDPMARGPVS